MADENKKKESRIENLSLETRRLIFWLLLIVSTVIVIMIWFFSLNLSLAIPPSEGFENQKFEKIKVDLKSFFENTNQGIEELKAGLNGNIDQALINSSSTATGSEKIIPSLPN